VQGDVPPSEVEMQEDDERFEQQMAQGLEVGYF